MTEVKTIKLIIAGSRTIDLSINQMRDIFDIFFPVLNLNETFEIVSGGASGVDKTAKEFVKDCNNNDFYWISKYTEFLADWETHGKAAGPIRNKKMAEYADRLLLIWDGESRGSKSMKNEMTKLNKPIYELIIRKPV